MTLRLDVYHHVVRESESDLRALLRQILAKETEMAGELAALTQEVQETKTVIDSAITLIQGLKAALDAAGTDPAALAALSAELDAKQGELAAAIQANTPATP